MSRGTTALGLRVFFAAAAAACVSGGVGFASVSAIPAAGVSGEAPGGPGATSYLDIARKDCFGTARDTTSKVWFTVAHGVLSDVYSPTIENTNVNTVQYVVTDGRTFADLQQRDMSYAVSSPDRSGMVCRVTSTDAKHGFALVSDYIADPARASIVVQTRLESLRGRARSLKPLKVYVRYDASIDNSGGGGSVNGGPNDATVAPATTALVSSDSHPASGPFAAQVVGALLANRRFGAESTGFVGTPSDGLSQLDVHHRLVNTYRSARDGNVVQTALIAAPAGRPFTLALGFGSNSQAAVQAATSSARQPFARTLAQYVNGWRTYDAALHPPPRHLPGYSGAADASMQQTYWLSANVLKAAEDKTNPGAFVASPTDPWGQSVPAKSTDPGWTYREVFARDSYETFTGLLADGDRASARAMVTFMFDRVQQADGSFPRDSLLSGAVAPDTFGLSEIDEDAYPLLMAWQAGFAGDSSFYRDHVRRAADFVVDHGPSYGVERWEEHPGYSPSTLAAEIAGLVAAAHLAAAAGDATRANLYLATADDYQRHVKAWTVTTTGPYARHRYFIRLSPTGNPNAAETYDLGNGSLKSVDQRSVIDAGFLELTRLGELPAGDSDVTRSLGVVDSVLASHTASGTGWHRYGIKAKGSTDGYGDCYKPDPTDCLPTGAPWFPKAVGSGHLWLLLSGERAEQQLQGGGVAGPSSLALAMQHMTWGIGLVPEQVWEDPTDTASPFGTDPATASIGFINGKAAGSATPLIWAQAQYLRLVRDLQAKTVFDQPAITRERYVSASAPAVVPLRISSPPPGAITSTATTSVSGTTTPGAGVSIAAGQPGSGSNPTSVIGTVADSHGAFDVTIPSPPGATLITATATVGQRATGWAQQTLNVPYPSLSAAYDNVGITSDSDTSPGDFDDAGNSYSAQALAGGTPDALTPGSPVTVDGVTMTWPNVAAGEPDNVVADGQTLPVSGSGSKLGFLGASVYNTATGPGTITYTDGSTQSFTLAFSAWDSTSAPAPGTSVVTTTHRWNTPTGPNGSGGVRNVYFASVALEVGKTPAFVTLPEVSNGVGATTAMHIFAVARGGESAAPGPRLGVVSLSYTPHR
jgi:glucan 1,4-alpha-glucosidase